MNMPTQEAMIWYQEPYLHQEKPYFRSIQLNDPIIIEANQDLALKLQ